MMNKQMHKRTILDSCYDHIGGILGEALFKFLLKEKWIENIDGEYNITDKGWEELEEQLKKLYLAIKTLNQLDRAIVLLYLEKRSYEQIGEITGISSKNVSVRIVRIKEKLRQIINKTH
jgi:RNA polymerase sigma factor (sigma-70 family)